MLWAEPGVACVGTFDRIPRAAVTPPPVKRPIPIWMGGGPAPVDLRCIECLADAADRDPHAFGVQGRMDVHGALDDDRLALALEAWTAAGVDTVSVHARGQGGVDSDRRLVEALG